MLSKSQIGFIKSLHQKKYRKEHGIFIIEGLKSIVEFVPSSYQIHSIYYLAEYQSLLPNLSPNIKLFEVNNTELEKISTLQAPQGILALVHQLPVNQVNVADLKGKFSLMLDGIQDPGNLGTIIRTADWFGFQNIICSTSTAEVYNPKTIQATMGSLCRVNIFYEDLAQVIAAAKLPVYGALLEGKNCYQQDWGTEGILVLGNEGRGISADVLPVITHPVTIPRTGGAESLNVAISAGILCSEIRRNLKE